MLYKIIPYPIFWRLFGDRKLFGTETNPTDKDFLEWKENYLTFYNDNQKRGIGRKVNHASFRITKNIDYSNKNILEVGPGLIEHLDYNSTRPKSYTIADINEDFLSQSEERLKKYGVKNIHQILITDKNLPIETNSQDIVISFHQLEHILHLDSYLLEIKRILRPNGILIGAVPCEGGIAWGLGRFLTSRRYVKKHMNFNYDKIICWEHPNFVNRIQKSLQNHFFEITSVKKPFSLLGFDFNLTWSFIYSNQEKQ